MAANQYRDSQQKRFIADEETATRRVDVSSRKTAFGVRRHHSRPINHLSHVPAWIAWAPLTPVFNCDRDENYDTFHEAS